MRISIWLAVIVSAALMLIVPSGAFAQGNPPLDGRWTDDWGVLFNLSSTNSGDGQIIDGSADFSNYFGTPQPLRQVYGYAWWNEGNYVFYLSVADDGTVPPLGYYVGYVQLSGGAYAPCEFCRAETWWVTPDATGAPQYWYDTWLRQPTGLSIQPSAIGRGQCFSATFGMASNLAVDVIFSLNGGPPQYGSDQGEYGDYPIWRILDDNGQTLVCTDDNTPAGAYHFSAAGNSEGGYWVEVNADVTVYPGQQPIGFFITPVTLAQGDCFSVSVENGANMTLDVLFSVNGSNPFLFPYWMTLDQNGQATACTDPNWWGLITFVAVRNALNNDWDLWVSVNMDLSIELRQPTSLTVNPSILTQGDCYVLTVGNGANMTLDVAYQLDYGPLQSIAAWPTLDPNGQAFICTDAGTWIGVTTLAYIRNTWSPGNTGWVETATDVFVYPPGPVITGIDPPGGNQGTEVEVTLTGAYLVGATLTTTYSGLTIQDAQTSADSITATFVISPMANPGEATITVTTVSGTATVQFSIASPFLSKEYIYLDGHVVAIDRP